MDNKHLHILWTSSDPLTAEHMIMMYATNSLLRHWWDEVTVVVWGGAQKLLCESESVIEKFKIAGLAGVKFTACQACAVNLGTRDKLIELGVEVISWGPLLTELIQNNMPLITI